MALLEKKLNELKTGYDKYFTGVERIEPVRLREEVQRMIRQAGTWHITNTGLKFKRDNIVAQFNSYTQYWNRILRRIEDGTYERDVFKMKLKERAGSMNQTKPAASGSPNKQSGDGYDSVYNDLMNARKKAGIPTNSMDRSAFEENLRRQSETIKKKYGASRVDFVVGEKDGKPVVKAVPKK
ncbi:MAG: hypothetical protein JW885_10865 [Deltaproteobacteria bacterium]|nr:hypothetical protein [Candidatus Zymogenaceae bacterium]